MQSSGRQAQIVQKKPINAFVTFHPQVYLRKFNHEKSENFINVLRLVVRSTDVAKSSNFVGHSDRNQLRFVTDAFLGVKKGTEETLLLSQLVYHVFSDVRRNVCTSGRMDTGFKIYKMGSVFWKTAMPTHLT